MAAVGAILAIAGAWFFESIFASGRAPVDLASWWPAILIVAGVLMVGTTLVRPATSHRPTGAGLHMTLP